MGPRLTANDVDRACVEVLDAHREEYTWRREEVAGIVFYTIWRGGVELGRWRISPGTERAPSVRWVATSSAVKRGARRALEAGYLPEDEAELHQAFVELTKRVKEHIESVHLVGPHWGKWYEEWSEQHGARRGSEKEPRRLGAHGSTLDRVREVKELVRQGVKKTEACKRAGIDPRTYDRYALDVVDWGE